MTRNVWRKATTNSLYEKKREMEEQKNREQAQDNASQKEYGTGWMQFLYTIGMPFRILVGFGGIVAGVQGGDVGILIGFLGFLYMVACGYICFSYWKNRWIGVYPEQLYRMTLILLWQSVSWCVSASLLRRLRLAFP